MEPKAFRNGPGAPLPIMSRKEIALFKNSPKQYVCVEMLQDGYHRSYEELYSLLRSEKDRRARAPAGSPGLQGPLLEEQRDKLETIWLHLSLAEKAEREGSWTAVCQERLHLGCYFSRREDLWLSFHFYRSCADREHGGRSRPAMEARLHLAELHLQQGDLEEARRQAETGLEQAEEGGWLDSEGRPLRTRACRELEKIYTLMGESSLAARDYEKAKKMLHLASKMASEGEDTAVQAEAVFREGLGFQATGDHQAAKQFFSSCFQIFSALQDVKGQVKTNKARAKSLESEGNLEESLQVLKTSAELCRSSGLQDELFGVCLHTGNMYFTKGQHQKAGRLYEQAHQAASTTGSVDLMQLAEVKMGVAWARCDWINNVADMQSAAPAAARRLVAWKETRGFQD